MTTLFKEYRPEMMNPEVGSGEFIPEAGEVQADSP